MSVHESCGCDEYRELSRRQFLAVSGGAALAAVGAPAWLPSVAYAKDYRSNRDVLVSVFLRGASDGLTMCAPYGDADYYAARPNLYVPQPGSSNPQRGIALDGFFCFPPSMAPLLELYNYGALLVVHATGSTDPSRSHFDAQRYMENGKPADISVFTGWLGRHLASAPPATANPVMRGVALSYGLPRTMAGAPSTLPIPDLANYNLGGNSGTLASRRTAITDMYWPSNEPLRTAALNTQRTINTLQAINFPGYAPHNGVTYPTNSFGTALKSAAALIRAQVGVEAVHVDVGGWDLHDNLGPLTGPMANLMTALSTGLAAFHTDLIDGTAGNVTTVVLSEFGRRLRENGSAGNDHGHGNCMLLIGPEIAGGRVLTQWPGLAVPQLFQGLDLQVTIDFRDVLAEVVQNRLGNANLGYVFPDYVPTFRGVTKSAV